MTRPAPTPDLEWHRLQAAGVRPELLVELVERASDQGHRRWRIAMLRRQQQ